MSQFFHIHPHNPQMRLVLQAVDVIQQGKVIVLPTDTAYVLACQMEAKESVERIQRIRRLDHEHHFSLLCRNLHDFGHLAHVDNPTFRVIKELVPGPYVFLLPATKNVPRRLMHAKSKSIALRIPDNAIIQGILSELGGPLLSSTLVMPGLEVPLNDPEEIYDMLKKQVDMVIDGGLGGLEGTSVLDCRDGIPDDYTFGEPLNRDYL